LALIALAAFWLQFFNELRGEWDVNPQYGYGYTVPLLGIILIWRRWSERPAGLPGRSFGVGSITAIALFALLPLRLVLEANPEWRLAYWFHGGLVLTLSFCFLYRAGGWSWVKFFAIPLIFMLVAVPWPMEWEQFVIQGLMRSVAMITVEVVGWFGIPALQHGNLIEVGNGIVGINEACSGVRSLQSALMLSLFLGELYRFSAKRRMVLLGASIVVVLAANVTRTSFLTWTAAQHGLHQMEAWHDLVGMVFMIIILLVLFGLAWLMHSKTNPAPAATVPAVFDLSTLPCELAIAALSWLVLIEVANETWYRLHENHMIANAQWSVAWPKQNPNFKKTAIAPESLAILRCSNSDAAAWEDENGYQWSAFFLRWNAGKNSVQLAKGHRPDICFPAAGANLVARLGQITATVNGVPIPFQHQTFASKTGVMQVFYCLWSDHISANEKNSAISNSRDSRLQAVLDGKRNLGQQVLEVVISGPTSDDSAVSLFQQTLPSLVRLN
jgi:exosortase